MSVLLLMFSVMLSLVCATVSVWYQKAYITETKPGFTCTLKEHKKMFILLAAAFVAMAFMLVYTQKNRNMRSDVLIQVLLIWYGVAAAAVIDFKVKKIPNKIVLVLLAVRAVFLTYGIIFENDPVKITVLRAVFGMLTGGGVMLVCMFFSKGGVGAGDMKLFAVIGFCFGLTGVIQVMIYTLFVSAVFCIGLLITGKAKLHSTVPMAPFIVTGLTFYYLLLT